MVTFIFSAFCIEHIIPKMVIYEITTVLSVLLYIQMIKKKQLNMDFGRILQILFLGWVIISSLMVNGLIVDIIFNRHVYMFVTAFTLLYAFRYSKNEKKLFKKCALCYCGITFLLNMIILFNATTGLINHLSKKEMVLGCVSNGRLIGLTNSNILAIECLVCIMISFYLVLNNEDRRKKRFLILGVVVAWMNICLANTRSAIVWLSIYLGFCFYIYICNRIGFNMNIFKRALIVMVAFFADNWRLRFKICGNVCI